MAEAGTNSPQGLFVSGLTPKGAPSADRRSRIRDGCWVSGIRFMRRGRHWALWTTWDDNVEVRQRQGRVHRESLELPAGQPILY